MTDTKKKYLNVGQLKYLSVKSMSMYTTQYLVGAPLARIRPAQ